MKKIIVLSTLLLAVVFASANSQAIECLKKGSWQTITYDLGKNGQKITKRVKVGSGSGDYSCMGRCGKKCASRWLPWTDKYTKRCLIHDLCSREQKASGGIKDKNCGDEFDEAIGDWILAPSRCR